MKIAFYRLQKRGGSRGWETAAVVIVLQPLVELFAMGYYLW